jgi:hypothetical protein
MHGSKRLTARMAADGAQRTMGMDMTEDEQRKARERDEIAARVAAFRDTQEKFRREREAYCVSTLDNARKAERPSLWP